MSEVEVPIVEPGPGRDRSALFQRLVLLGLFGVLVGALALAVWLSGDGDADDPDADGTEVAIVDLDLAGPYDGLDSEGHPVVADPDLDLVDGQMVTVQGTGFTPHATVGAAQCWFGGGPGGQDNCDIASAVISTADGQGLVGFDFPVQRFLNTSFGTVDCAEGGLEEGCGIGVGNVENYDDSGTTRLFFDPNVDGAIPPRIEVTPAAGLADGDVLTIKGVGFVPGEPVRITQCMVGGMNGIGGCFGQNPTGTAEADGDGRFGVTVPAQRLVRGGQGELDCFVGPYPCLVVAAAERMPNTVRLEYDGSERPPDGLEYTVVPNDGLVDGDTVRVELFDLRVAGPVEIRQCADQGPEGLTCESRAMAEVIDSAVVVDVVVRAQPTMTLTQTDAQGNEVDVTRSVDCAEPGRTCFLSTIASGLEDLRIPIHFRGG